ncbi:Type I secretion membrane fusion protein, HlyD family [Desulfamplus magnetovallimortis]|uniref:Type I secretion membrane fusion protein, HlyD family n=1 Tax=Desulfamplus magnetovallimortis TaxID=1246637 RepID=A0A1W1HD37_9BACT|nr:HlyD family type I secretion periplasmic adaptor subunit [Desulfamplus magnetovallimortis]SLM30356.1 Type I secretion membrane fusion protein, HlyD family [Desulfamplus magnetovallimortis]
MEKDLKQKKTGRYRVRPGWVIFAGLFVILLFFGGLGGVAAYLPFSGAVIAPGVVKVSQEKKTVQHLEGGLVQQIFVREGDRVNKGDVLIKLRSSQVTSSVALLKGRLASKQIEAARLEAQRDFRKNMTIPEGVEGNDADIEQWINSEKNLFEKAKTSLESRISSQKARISQLQEKAKGTKREVEANAGIIESLEEEIKAKEALMEGRYMDKAQVLTLKRQLAEQTGQKARLEQLIAEIGESIEEIKFSILSLENSYREEAAAQLNEVRDEIFQIRRQLAPQIDADERLSIRAPVSGVVLNMAVHSEHGGVIRPGEPILDIVPDDADLIIECTLRQDKITQVYIDQETKVQLGAFNRITTPPVPGKVSYISADRVEQRMPTGQIMSAYVLHISVDKKDLDEHDAWLSPGMPATCFITTEKRTFLQYLVEPILLNLDQSLRETL